MVSPYLQRPKRSLAEALRECGRAREQSAMIVILPRNRSAEPERCDSEGLERGSSAYPTDRLGASA